MYGASKVAVCVYLEGLRSPLHPYGIRVVEVKSGPVDTPMTEHLEKNWMLSQPETIAAGVVRTFDGRGNVLYLPWFWWWIML